MSGAQGRMAEALLRGVGGRTVRLRIPAPAMAGDAGEQVGLAMPRFQDIELRPVVLRKARPHVPAAGGVGYELLVSAAAVLEVVGTLEYESAAVLFAQAAGVVVDDALLAVEAVTAAEAFGVVSLYRVKVRGAVGDRK